jgi:2-keto-4-pentenoate hydratase/2-oxohepta-3-ene-1,7-dioic acid hydratase in catechol pathway
MRLATMVTPRGLRLHVRARSGYVDVADGTGEPALASLRGLLEADALDAARGLLDADGADFSPDQFGPAVPEPRRILCLGVNYREHAIEGGRAVPTWPESFVRGEGSAIGPYADLVKPALTGRFDFEGELGAGHRCGRALHPG